MHPGLCCSEALQTAGLETLQQKRQTMRRVFFKDMLRSSHKLHHLLPPPPEFLYNLRDSVSNEKVCEHSHLLRLKVLE